MAVNTREQLHQQIDNLPDHLIEQIARFTHKLVSKQAPLEYSDWESSEWQEFSLLQFFSEDDEVEYFLEDAQQIYKYCVNRKPLFDV